MSAIRSLVAVLLVLSVLGSAAVTPAAARSAPGSDAPACFPDGGYPLRIGDGDPGIAVVIHTSLFPDVLGGSNASSPAAFDERNETTERVGNDPLRSVSDAPEAALGMEAYGVALGREVVFMQVGVLFDGVGDAWAFVRNPFDAFSLAFHYRLSLSSVFGGDVIADYETSEVPVEGLKAATCS